MSQSVRVYWKPTHGRHTMNFNWPDVINARSVVVVTASEYDPERGLPEIPLPGGPPIPGDDERYRYVGEAVISVASVSPHGPEGADPGGVSFDLHVDWPDPLFVATDITVL